MENTEDGELAKRLKEIMKRIGPSIGFEAKIVKRMEVTLRIKLPLTTIGMEPSMEEKNGAPHMYENLSHI